MSSSSRKPGQYTIGSRAVAVAIMAEILQHAKELADAKHGGSDMADVADELVKLSWDVEYKPHSERLVLIVDAGIQSERRRPDAADPGEEFETRTNLDPTDPNP